MSREVILVLAPNEAMFVRVSELARTKHGSWWGSGPSREVWKQCVRSYSGTVNKIVVQILPNRGAGGLGYSSEAYFQSTYPRQPIISAEEFLGLNKIEIEGIA